MENGISQLTPFFKNVELKLYPDALKVKEIEPLIAYLLSTYSELKDQLIGQKLTAFRHFLEGKKKENDGFILITKVSCLFEAQ